MTETRKSQCCDEAARENKRLREQLELVTSDRRRKEQENRELREALERETRKSDAA